MLKLFFLLGEHRNFSGGEDLLINILNRLSIPSTEYEIQYCYESTPPSQKKDRVVKTMQRRDQLIWDLVDAEKVIVGLGWMALEVLIGVSKTQASRYMGLRYPIPPLRYEAWFTYDPAAALFDPNLYVDILGCISAAIRYADRPIQINTKIQPYQWNNL